MAESFPLKQQFGINKYKMIVIKRAGLQNISLNKDLTDKSHLSQKLKNKQLFRESFLIEGNIKTYIINKMSGS